MRIDVVRSGFVLEITTNEDYFVIIADLNCKHLSIYPEGIKKSCLKIKCTRSTSPSKFRAVTTTSLSEIINFVVVQPKYKVLEKPIMDFYDDIVEVARMTLLRAVESLKFSEDLNE